MLVTVTLLVSSCWGTLPRFPAWQSMYVGNIGTPVIYKVSSNKNVTVYARDTPNAGTIFFEPNGDLIVACGASIRRVTATPDGSPATLQNGHVTVLATGFQRVRGVARDGRGNLWLGEFLGPPTGEFNSIGQPLFEPGRVMILRRDGSLLEIGKEQVYSLTTDNQGTVYISKQFGGRLIRADLNFNNWKTVATNFVSRSVTFDAEGNCYSVGFEGILRLSKEAFQRPDLWPFDFRNLNKTNGDQFRSMLLRFDDDQYGQMHPYHMGIDAQGLFYQTDPAPDKHTATPSLGFVFQFDRSGRRSVFLRLGATTPAFVAFWPKARTPSSG